MKRRNFFTAALALIPGGAAVASGRGPRHGNKLEATPAPEGLAMSGVDTSATLPGDFPCYPPFSWTAWGDSGMVTAPVSHSWIKRHPIANTMVVLRDLYEAAPARPQRPDPHGPRTPHVFGVHSKWMRLLEADAKGQDSYLRIGYHFAYRDVPVGAGGGISVDGRLFYVTLGRTDQVELVDWVRPLTPWS